MPVLDGETYLSWRDGEPLSYASSLKLILAGSKEGIWLKWSKWLLFSPYCYQSGPKLSAIRSHEIANTYI